MTQSLPSWMDGYIHPSDFMDLLHDGRDSVDLPQQRFTEEELGTSPAKFQKDMELLTGRLRRGEIDEAGDWAAFMLIRGKKSPVAVRAITEAYLSYLPIILDDDYILGPWIAARLGQACCNLKLDDLTDKLKDYVEKHVGHNLCEHPQSFLTDTRVMLHQTGADAIEAMGGFLGELSFKADGHLHFSRVTKANEWFRAVVPQGKEPAFFYCTNGKGTYDYSQSNIK